MQAAALPTLFLSHGSPMHAIQPGAVRAVWEAIARDLPRPKAILIASAHWETDVPEVTGHGEAGNDPRFLRLPEAACTRFNIRHRAP